MGLCRFWGFADGSWLQFCRGSVLVFAGLVVASALQCRSCNQSGGVEWGEGKVRCMRVAICSFMRAEDPPCHARV